MRLVKILAVMIFTSTMFGCSTVNYNYEAKINYFSKPALDEVVEVYVGDYMIDQGKSVTLDFLILNRTIDGVLYDIHKGSYSRVGEHKGSSYFSPTTSKGQPISYAAGLVDTPVALHINSKDEVCVTSVSYQAAACYEGSFKIKDKTVVDNQAFQQTLIYNGSVGEKINISYREFSNDSARNAFTNNVEYDMKKSNFINYKGARIEVISYDNTSIKFRVIKHFRDDRSIEL
ncbi:hypothetical protein [Neptunomonas antarctica]|uniref:Lipoprotein n=1 Tax=Neptunomonas antarctica TaxID=619304 RepID=A0A1N7L4I0_9GAMM|nr:hypothetical protein [Neptunomonas antarctica]SIS68724.1 hypothetical protein SAMN05421760_103225 [Neptunomonas antarctica]